MNEGMFIALRGLGQETNSLLMQILEEQRRTNEILSQLTAEKDYMVNGDPDYGNVRLDVKPKPAAKKGK